TIQPKQPINKTIGINKLGTLLSSQTTDTPSTTTTHQGRRSLRSNFPNLPDLRLRRKSISRISISGKISPANFQRPKEQPDFSLYFGGLAARGYQLFAVSPAAT
ncbi:hypothetical protein, partial [Pseudarthrobacter sp. YAF2]|uniref:hypothetical protein n=1 Tax=Pseudarthrobacter sp. YAF2 TaxID=3233078 RepID=UPI003F9E191A